MRRLLPISGGADWPDSGGMQRSDVGVNTASSRGVTVTTAGTFHTKGSYATLIAATDIAGGWLMVTATSRANNNPWLVDIALGPAAAEQVIIPNWQVSGLSAGGMIATAMFPISIPRGSRVSARAQGVSSSDVYITALVLSGDASMVPFGRAVDLGTDLSNSRGTVLVSDASGFVKGPYSELSAGVPFRVRWMSVSLNRAVGYTSYADIAIGGAGSEVTIVEDLYSTAGFSGNQSSRDHLICVDIPAGTRLAARAASSFTASNVAYAQVMAIG